MFFNEIYAGADTITLNTTPTTVTFTNPLPANVNIPNISNVFDLFKLDTDISNLVLGVLSVFIMVMNMKSYFKVLLMILVGIFINPDLVFGFVYAFSLFSAGELARGKWIYMLLLAIVLIHILIRSNFITNINSSSINIDWLFLIIESVVLVTCIFVPMIYGIGNSYSSMTEEEQLMSILDTMKPRY